MHQLTLFIILCISASSSGQLTIPLSKRASPPFRSGYLSPAELDELNIVTDLDALKDARDGVIDKFADARGNTVVKRMKEMRRKRDAVDQFEKRMDKRDVRTTALTNHNFDTTYSAQVNFGTPATSFDILMDTGSSDTWVTASNCTCTSSGCTSCSGGGSWDPSTSSSFAQRGKVLSISYGSGIVTGRTGQDVVELAGFTINDQVVGVVDKAARVLPGDVEGLMGLAFGSIARSGGTPWWLRVLQGDASGSGGTADSPLLSFWLSRYVDSPTQNSDNPGGQFIIGGTNTTLYTGDITYYNVVQPAKWWVIQVAGVGVQDGGDPISVADGASQAIVDTGTTLVGGEDTVLNSLFATVPGAIQGSTLATRLTGFWALPCNSTATVQLTFDSSGTAWPYSSADLLYQRIDDLMPNYCLSSLFTYSSADPHSIDYTPNGTPYWLIGDSFLKNVYSVFNLGGGGSGDAGVQGMGNDGSTAQVGFATLSGTDGEIGLAGGGGDGSTPANASGNATQQGGTASASMTMSAGPHSGNGTDVPLPGVIPDVDTTVVIVTATEGPSPTQSGNGAVPGVRVGTGLGALLALVGLVVAW